MLNVFGGFEFVRIHLGFLCRHREMLFGVFICSFLFVDACAICVCACVLARVHACMRECMSACVRACMCTCSIHVCVSSVSPGLNSCS